MDLITTLLYIMTLMILFILHCQLQISKCPILKFQPEKLAFNCVKSVLKTLKGQNVPQQHERARHLLTSFILFVYLH